MVEFHIINTNSLNPNIVCDYSFINLFLYLIFCEYFFCIPILSKYWKPFLLFLTFYHNIVNVCSHMRQPRISWTESREYAPYFCASRIACAKDMSRLVKVQNRHIDELYI